MEGKMGGKGKKKAAEKNKTALLKADLHIHTARSGDSDISAEDIIQQAIVNELDVVGVVDHNTTKGGKETKKLAKKESPKLIVLVGQEVKTKEGEIIVFGLEKDLQKKKPLIETIKKAGARKGFIIIPHPFDVTRYGIGKHVRDIIPYIDAVEVFNAKSVWKRFNANARAFAEEHNLPMVAGSDAHFPSYIGMAYTLIESRPDEKAIYNAIKKGKTVVSGKTAGLINRNLLSRIKYLFRNVGK
jgi:hypothetical protein